MLRVYRGLKKMNDLVHRINGGFAVFLFALLVIVINYQIFTRNILNFTPQWSEPIATLSMKWLTFVGAAYGVRLRSHISIEIFVKMLPEMLKKKIIVGGMFGILWFAVDIMLLHGWKLTVMMMNQYLPAIPVKVGYSYLAVPVGGVLMIIYIIEDILEVICKGNIVRGDDFGASSNITG